MGRHQRMKGKRFEQEVAAKLRAIFGDQVRRGWQTREGYDAPDVDGTPFRVEAKHHHVVNIAAAIRQALEDREKAGDKRWVLAITKSDRCTPLATMPLEEFLLLVAEWSTRGSMAESCLQERAEGKGGCGACAACCKELKDHLGAAEAGVRALLAAVDACDREAERPRESQSSAPRVRYINTLKALRAFKWL